MHFLIANTETSTVQERSIRAQVLTLLHEAKAILINSRNVFLTKLLRLLISDELNCALIGWRAE